ncbi:MAG: hypothetical protein HY052_00720 [Proteobacteria bacterium]|nr:hypothetical protein [Pseudomonadota bacterium]
MKFAESGLPNNKLVEDAFNYSHANVMSYRDEVMKDFTQQINQSHAAQLRQLDADKVAGTLSPDDYKKEKEALDKMRDEQMKMGPRIVDRELDNNFNQRRLGPAQELVNNGEKASPELLAAVILNECVRSPLDYLKLAKKFGDKVADVIAQMQHIDVYPGERDANLAAANSDVKRAYMAQLITNLGDIMSQVKLMAKVSPGQKVMFADGQEEALFGNAKSVWGNDKKLDQRFVAVFNSAAEATTSPFRMEVDEKNNLELIKSNLNPPTGPKVTPPKGPGDKHGLGDDVF